MSRWRAPVLLSRLLSASSSVACAGSAAQLAAMSIAFREASVPLRPALPSLLNQLYRIDAAMVRPLPSATPSRTRSLHSSRLMTSRGHRGTQARCETAFAARPFATSAETSEAAGRAASSGQQRASQRRANAAGGGSAVVAEQEGFSAITDKHIPQRPVSPVEATSYTVVIIAGESEFLQLGDPHYGFVPMLASSMKILAREALSLQPLYCGGRLSDGRCGQVLSITSSASCMSASAAGLQ